MNAERRYRRCPSVLFRTLPGEVLLASSRRESVDHLTGPASAIWNLLDSPRTLPSLVGALADAFQASTEQIAEDVEVFLQDLRRREWVEETPPDA